MTDDLDYPKLGRYLAGECSVDEGDEVRWWLAADPAHEEALQALARVWRGAEAVPPEWNVDSAWARVRPELGCDEPVPAALAPPRACRPPPRFLPPTPRSWLAAAVACLLVGSAAVVVTRLEPRWSSQAPVLPMREVATVKGQRAELGLSDGSRIILGVDSRVRFAPVFGERSRDVFLEGEAYFVVQHDSARPFRVHAANGIAEDLGTEFVVTAYPETRGLQIVVASGAVALRSADSVRAQPRALLTLTRGDLGRLDSTGTATLSRGVEIERYLAWMRGDLVFDETRLSDVTPVLARWFDLEIRLADTSAAGRRLTATFRNEAAPYVIDRLARALDLEVAWNENVVVLRNER